MREETKPDIYHAAFDTPPGRRVLADLLFRFHDIESYAKGDPHHTAYREGQRSVMRFIKGRIEQALKEGEVE